MPTNMMIAEAMMGRLRLSLNSHTARVKLINGIENCTGAMRTMPPFARAQYQARNAKIDEQVP